VGLSGSAAASTLLEVVRTPPNFTGADHLILFDMFDEDDVFNANGDLLFSQQFVWPEDGEDGGCSFDIDSSCTFAFDEALGIEYLVAKAGGYLALYQVMDGAVTVDVSMWGALTPELCLQNGGGKCYRNSPAISNIRGISAVPEPDSQILFMAGGLFVAFGIGRSRARQQAWHPSSTA
jgi:hypothetical protein